jgi:hypothetical protein
VGNRLLHQRKIFGRKNGAGALRLGHGSFLSKNARPGFADPWTDNKRRIADGGEAMKFNCNILQDFLVKL